MIGMKFDDVDGEEPKPVQPVRPETFGIGVWKTRSGWKAEIDKDKDCILKNYDLTGVIHFPLGKKAVEATWTRSGDFLSGRVHGNDLVGPWVEEAPVVEAPVVEAPVAEAPVVEAPVRPEAFERGVWKTRDGHKAEVTKNRPLHKYQLLGVIHSEDGTMNASWLRNGDFGDGDDAIPKNDLVGPWVEEAVEPMTFGVGVWKTRKGHKAVVTDDTFRALMNYELTGEIDFGGNKKLRTTWTKNGFFSLGEVSESDLVGPWGEGSPVTPAAEAPVVETPAFGLGMWRTQGGQRVDITRDLGSQYAFNLQGRVDSGIKMESWANDGTPMRDVSEPHLKLVGPWVEWQPVEKVAETPVVEAPKFGVNTWKTRNGSIARVDSIAKDKTYPLIGSIISGPDYPNGEEPDIDTTEMIWTAKGKVFFVTDSDVDPNDDPGLIDQSIWEEPHDLDLISPAVEEEPKQTKPANEDVLNLQSLCDKQKNSIQVLEDSIKSLTGMLRVSDRKVVHLDGELTSMAVLLRDAVRETGRLNKLIAGLREENVVQGFKLSAAIDERDTEKLRAKLDLEVLKAVTEQKQNDTFLPAIRRMKVLLFICRIVAVLLLAAIPLAGQWIVQHGPEWMVDSSGKGILKPGALFAVIVAWMGVCMIGFSIEGEIRRIIESQETEYWRLRNKVTPGRREDW